MWAAQFREMGLSMYPCEDTSWKRDITRKEENVIEERIVIRLVEKIVKLSSDNVAVNLRIFVRSGSGRHVATNMWSGHSRSKLILTIYCRCHETGDKHLDVDCRQRRALSFASRVV